MSILHLKRDDENMNNTKKVVGATLLMCMVLISAGSVAAMTGNQNGGLNAAGDMLQEQTREQLKDGTCCDCDSVAYKQQDMLQEQTKLQLKDCSCCECIDPVADQQQDMLQEQTKEQLKDGSCYECDPVATQQQEMLQEQTREQLKDGSCCDCPGKP